jgi:transcriptional regulator with GAF, ATPase, and Fis domain
MAASHVDLERAVREGSFREDLYYRLAVFPLQIPALRHRPEDIVPLAEHLLQRVADRTGRGPWTLSQDARRELQRRPWPGNVRELVNALERAAILRPHGELQLPHVAEPGQVPAADRPVAAPEADDLVLPLQEMERRHLQRALTHTGGKIYGPDGAAALLQLKPTTLQSRLRKLGLR